LRPHIAAIRFDFLEATTWFIALESSFGEDPNGTINDEKPQPTNGERRLSYHTVTLLRWLTGMAGGTSTVDTLTFISEGQLYRWYPSKSSRDSMNIS
jgi:hypothetical protein